MNIVIVATIVAVVGLILYIQGETLLKRFPKGRSLAKIFNKLKGIGKIRLILMIVGIVIFLAAMIVVGIRGQL